MRKLLLMLLMITTTFFSCGKRGDVIPNIPVDFSASLTDPRLAPLNSPGGVVLISGYGIAGIIIYRSPFNSNSYLAYDRCSSYQPENKCAVTLDDTRLTVTDPCSGAKFSLDDGSPVKAPATRSLKSYTVTNDGFTIHIYN